VNFFGTVQSQIRRVPLPRIADVRGNISYEELIGLVLVFSQLEGNTMSVNTKSYTVTLTYYDDEEDLITLSSTEELKEAIGLFAEQKFMRITTSIKPKTHYTPLTYTPTYRRGDTVSHPVNNEISNIGENFPPAVAKSPSTLFKEKTSNAKMAGRNNRGQQLKGVKGVKADEVSSIVKPCKNHISRPSNTVLPASNIKETSPEATDQNSSESSCKPKGPEKTDAIVPFIHGRHTCDRCLTTPIIGKRYHSTNLKDYDLCQKCFDNYKGSAIEYEAVELRRDVAFQNRWRQRHEYTMKMRNSYQSKPERSNVPLQCCQKNHVNSNNHRVRVANQGGVGFIFRQNNPTPSRVDSDRLPSSDPVSSSANHATTQNDVSNSNDFDALLKEAIRRSLEDVVPKKDLQETNETVEMKGDSPNQKSLTDDVVPKINTTKKVNKTSERISDPPNQESTPNIFVPREHSTKKTIEIIEMQGGCENEDLIEDKVSESDIGEGEAYTPRLKAANADDIEDVETNRKSPNEQSILYEKKPAVVGKASKKEIPHSIHIMKHKMSTIEPPTSNDFTLDESSSSFQVKDVETMQEAMGTDSVDSEKLVSDSTGQDLLEIDTDHLPGSPSYKLGCFDNSKNTSFSSDAVGNGDVAEAMGKTLDMVVGVISEMLSESEVQEKPTESDEVLSSKSNRGEIIVNSNVNDDMVDEEEDDTDWSVVKSIGSNGTTESERIGKATEMLGSALFNSDMKNSGEDDCSNVVGSGSSFSIPSSVPTDLGTVHSDKAGQNQENCWANELELLRELGFDTESICIEILERIWSDSDAMATNIDLVVDELLSLKA